LFSVKPLFKRFERFEKSLYDFLKANWYNMKNRMLCGKQKFHAIHALPMPAFFVCTVSVKKLKFVSDFLLFSHKNAVQKNIRKSVKIATTKPELRPDEQTDLSLFEDNAQNKRQRQPSVSPPSYTFYELLSCRIGATSSMRVSVFSSRLRSLL